jgi:hypothetical protein
MNADSYAVIGVGEVWRHDANLIIYGLEADCYVEIGESKALAPLEAVEISRPVSMSRSMARPEWVQMVRKAVSELI